MAVMEAKDVRIKDLEERVAVLQQVCAEAYQLAGTVGAPEAALDISRPPPRDPDPPCVVPPDRRRGLRRAHPIGVTRKNPHAVALGRRGGKVASEAKTRAVRRNALKGGTTAEVRCSRPGSRARERATGQRGTHGDDREGWAWAIRIPCPFRRRDAANWLAEIVVA